MTAAVLSVTNVKAGSGAMNVVSDSGSINGTVRTFSQVVRKRIEDRMRSVAEGIATVFGTTSEVRYDRITDPVVNDAASTDYCRAAAECVAGKANVLPLEPVMGGEDFGGFLQVRPGAFMVIGQGEPETSSPHNFGVHSPFYDFNDAIIPIAANYFAELAERRLALD